MGAFHAMHALQRHPWKEEGGSNCLGQLPSCQEGEGGHAGSSASAGRGSDRLDAEKPDRVGGHTIWILRMQVFAGDAAEGGSIGSVT